MNIFFTPLTKHTCTTGCSYQECSEKYYRMLKDHPMLTSLTSLSQDKLLCPCLGSPLRNGDLVVLHVENQQQLQTLVNHKRRLEEYRLILILTAQVTHSSKLYHRLSPRFVTTTNQDVTMLIDVITNLQKYTAVQIPLHTPSNAAQPAISFRSCYE